MSFDLFAYPELKEIVYDCEDRYHHLERIMKASDGKYQKRFHEKQSADFIGLIEGFLVIQEDKIRRHSRQIISVRPEHCMSSICSRLNERIYYENNTHYSRKNKREISERCHFRIQQKTQ